MGVKRKRRSAKYETREGVMYIPDPLAPNGTGFREYCVTDAAWQRRREEGSSPRRKSLRVHAPLRPIPCWRRRPHPVHRSRRRRQPLQPPVALAIRPSTRTLAKGSPKEAMRRILKFEAVPGSILCLPISPSAKIIHVGEQVGARGDLHR